MENKLQPKIRFNRYIDSWMQRKIGDFSEETLGGGTPKTSVKEFWDGEIAWIQSSDLKEHKISGVIPKKKITKLALKESAAKLIPKNSIAVVTRVGVGKVAVMDREYATSQDFVSLTQLKVDKWFAGYSLYQKLQKELLSVQGTSIKGITKSELLDKTIYVPIKMEEQNEIGVFFKNLDATISLHQQELKTLKQTKQGFLQKMFPKEGETVPEVRVQGFNDQWREEKIGDITESFSGGTPSSNNKLYYGGKIPFIRSAEINSESTELFITEEGLKNSSAKIVSQGTILYAMYGATSGEVGISRIEGAINQAILAIKPIKGDNVNFIYQWLKKNKENIIKSFLQGGQGNLSGSIIKKLSILLPCAEEQLKIGEFFKQLDQTIELHEKELEALKETKKAFLQKMFV
ncbi:type I restriction enzyme S subunit [Chryseomicrobium aureum]|uniref:restriction endonuclease subunit S n=1 Tax=Chryseomicrobium aureum TaxID=1441723 RepID=UPI00195A1AAA|nr:type I restriction enzyme S subunit [Chryseomicrobium aureum]